MDYNPDIIYTHKVKYYYVLKKTNNQMKLYSVATYHSQTNEPSSKLLKTYTTTKGVDNFYHTTCKKYIIDKVKKVLKNK